MPELKLVDVILRQRKNRNMTQEELANDLGVTAQAISNWERGGYPDITMLPSIANYFEIMIQKKPRASRGFFYIMFTNPYRAFVGNPSLFVITPPEYKVAK